MRSLVQALIVAIVVLFSGVGASAIAGPTVPSGAPIVAQYSSSGNYGNSYSPSSSTGIPRGLIRLVVGVIVLVVSGIGVLIRKLSS